MGTQIWEEINERKKSQDRRQPERKKSGAGMAKVPKAHPEGQSSCSDTQKDQKSSRPSFPTTHGKTPKKRGIMECWNDGATGNNRRLTFPYQDAEKLRFIVTSVRVGVQEALKRLDSCFRRNDNIGPKRTFSTNGSPSNLPHSIIPFFRYSLILFFNPKSSSRVLSDLFHPCDIQ
jgi:hypothetical protein